MVRPPNREVGSFPPDEPPPSSPLYIHPSDNPGTVLVTELLNGSNYVNWSRSMKTALLVKNKLGFINGSIKKPTDPLDHTLPHWERCNGIVVSWLRNATVPQIRSSLMYMDLGTQIWSDLRERFSQGDIARIYELKQQLYGLRQGSSDINTYYTDLRAVWDEFLDYEPKCWCECNACRCGSSQKWREHQQRDFAVHFLMGLSDSYAALRSHLLSLDPFPSISKIFSLVLQEERQKNIGLPPSTVIAPVSESPSFINAAQSFHSRGGKDKLYCTHCQRTNHTVDKCYQLHGYPPGFGRGRGRGMNNYSGESSSNMQKSVHNVGAQLNSDGSHVPQSNHSLPTTPTPNTLFAEQCQQLLTYLQSQIQGQAITAESALTNSSTGSSDFNASFSGCFQGNVDWDG